MKGIGNILDKGSKLVDSIGSAFDKNFTSKEEKLKIKNEILGQATSFLSNLIDAQKEILAAEIKGNWLQRSWRPILMLCFGFIVMYSFFLQPAFFPNSINIAETLPSDFWGLLKIGMGGYVIGRSGEKIAASVSETMNKK